MPVSRESGGPHILESLVYLIPALLVIAIAGVLLKTLKLKAPRTPELDAADETEAPETPSKTVTYTARTTLLSKAETQAFRLLYRKLNGIGYLCPKVRISDLISVTTPDAPNQRLKALSQLSQKHVDFAVMSASGKILFAVEVDDASHRAPKAIKRDQFVNEVFAKAKVPLFRGDLSELEQHAGLTAFIQTLIDARAAKQST